MLQKNLLFLHTAEEYKNYNEELKMNSIKSSPLNDFSTVVTICTLISILGLIGNGIICWLLCFTIKKTKFTVYVANLAVGDFLALLHMFISFLEFFTSSYFNTGIRQLMLIMFLFGPDIEFYFLAAMSTERCLNVFFPIWYQSHRKKCPTALICTFLWALSVTLKMLDHFLCTRRYILALNIGTSPCHIATVLKYIILFIVLTSTMVFSTLALCIRMKIKPQQDFPARLDISIWIIVFLHVILSPCMEIINQIIFSIAFNYYLEFYHLNLIFYCLGSTVNPFVYLLVGCWKWEKDQGPCYMFPERALRDNGNGRMRIQSDQEQA